MQVHKMCQLNASNLYYLQSSMQHAAMVSKFQLIIVSCKLTFHTGIFNYLEKKNVAAIFL
jgi:hypothetical protein